MSENQIPVWRSTKTYTHNVGLSISYRNWKAESHCRHLHGYSLQVSFIFEAEELDHSNFVVDFGGLRNLKGWLEDTFDHTCLVAEDDPEVELFKQLHLRDMITIRLVPATGCERFAEMVYEFTEQWIKDAGFGPRCKLVSVEVREHESNSAVFFKRSISNGAEDA